MRPLITWLGMSMLVALPTPIFAQATPEQRAMMEKGCLAQAQAVVKGFCNPIAGVTPEQLAVIKRQAQTTREALARSCTFDSAKSEFAKLDTCLGNLGKQIDQEGAEAKTRRAAAEPKVKVLQADARYVPARDRARLSQQNMAMACESATNARQQGSPNLASWEAQCDRAIKENDAATAVMRDLITQNGIDLRDGRALNLW